MKVDERRLEDLEGSLAGVEESGAAGATQVLPTRTREHVTTNRVDIERHLPGRLAGIEHVEHPVLGAQRAHFFSRVDQTAAGRDVGHRHHCRTCSKLGIHLGKVDLAVVVVVDQHHLDTEAPFELEEGEDVARVFGPTGDDAITPLEGVAVDRHIPCPSGVLDHCHVFARRADERTE